MTQHQRTRKKFLPPRRVPMPRVADAGGQLPPASSPQMIGTLPRLIHKPEVLQLTGVTFPTLWKWMREGTFPISFVVGGKTAWLESEIAEWIRNRPRSQFKKIGGG